MKLRISIATFALAMIAATSVSHAYTFDGDVPEKVRTQITQDLNFIKGLKGEKATPLHQSIFGAVDGALYVNFFETRVTHIGLDDCGGGNAVACVIPLYGSSRIWLTRNYTAFDHPQIAKMMVVFHEARHTETSQRNWPHATCPTPFLDADGKDMHSIWTGASLAGQPACDVVSKGSYGSSTIMLKNIQKYCTQCTEKVRQDAGIYADDQFKRITGASAKQEMLKDLY